MIVDVVTKEKLISIDIRKWVVLILMSTVSPAWSAVDAHPHQHHLGAATGAAWHDGKNSAYLGMDYVYRFQSDFALGAFIENVSGDFNIRAYGLTFGKFFSNGWKIGVGPGVEKKIKDDKTLLLVHVSGGYDWHSGNWSFGPIASSTLLKITAIRFISVSHLVTDSDHVSLGVQILYRWEDMLGPGLQATSRALSSRPRYCSRRA